MNVLLILFTFIIVLLALKVWQWRSQPPGPWGLPLLGYAPFLTKTPYKKFLELRKTYGDVMQLGAGINDIVVLNGFDTIEEAHTKIHAFAGRPQTVTFQALRDSGVTRFQTMQADEKWRFLRKSSTNALALFASSRNSRLEAVVLQGVKSLHDDLKQHQGRPFDPQDVIFECISGIVGAIMFGGDFNRQDKFITDIVATVGQITQFLQIGSAIDNLPFGLGKFVFRRRIQAFFDAIDPVSRVAEKHILAHKWVEDPRDIADALYKIAEEMKGTEQGVTKEQVRFIAQDLFGAGFVTTLESFRWLLNIMAAYPNIQAKVHDELDNFLSGQEPSLNDRSQMHYTEATVIESLRFASLIAMGLPHSAMEDVEFKGYHIKKGTLIVSNLYGVHYDEHLFPNPCEFKPERFLTEEGQINSKITQFVIPFMVGKRRCVGENLARQELFLLFASTMQKFKVSMDPVEPIDVQKAGIGFTRRPLMGTLIFNPRE